MAWLNQTCLKGVCFCGNDCKTKLIRILMLHKSAITMICCLGNRDSCEYYCILNIKYLDRATFIHLQNDNLLDFSINVIFKVAMNEIHSTMKYFLKGISFLMTL